MVDPKKQLADALAKAKKDKCNILTPAITTGGITKLHAVTTEQIELSPNPKDGDVYPHDKTKMIVANKGLEKLALLANIQMNKSIRTDPQNDRQYISYQAGGFLWKADASAVMCIKSYAMDFEVIEEEVLEMYQDRMKKYVKDKAANQWPNNLDDRQRSEWIHDKAKKEVRRRRKFKEQLCESGAQARVKRELLGLKGWYSADELKKPFVVVRVTLKPDYDDPEIKRLMFERAMSAQGQIFGTAPGSAITHQPAPQISHEQPPIEPAAIPNGDLDEDIPDADYEDAATEAAGENGAPDPAEVARADFDGAHTSSKLEILNKLIKQKAYDKKQLKRPMENWTDKQLVSFYDALVDMPDDDIPF